jgi:phosphoribosylaminoimidazole (AIR) synthetase
MGIGFCIIAPKASADKIVDIFAKHRMCCRSVGRIGKGRGEVATKIGSKKEVL